MNDLTKLKKLADQQIKEKARIEGRIESFTDRLKKEGFKTSKIAADEMKLLKSKIKSMKTTFQSKLDIFKDKYANDLSKIS